MSETETETLYEGYFMYTPALRFDSDADTHSAINIAADVLGLTMALKGYAKDYFDATSVEPQTMSDEGYKRFKERAETYSVFTIIKDSVPGAALNLINSEKIRTILRRWKAVNLRSRKYAEYSVYLHTKCLIWRDNI